MIFEIISKTAWLLTKKQAGFEPAKSGAQRYVSRSAEAQLIVPFFLIIGLKKTKTPQKNYILILKSFQ